MPFDHEGVKVDDVKIDIEKNIPIPDLEKNTPNPVKDNEDKTTKKPSCCSLKCFMIALLLIVFVTGLAGAASFLLMKDQVLMLKDKVVELLEGSEP